MFYNIQIIEWAPHYEDETIKPSIGRRFDILARAEEFYTCYAPLMGFSVRKGTSNLNMNRELVGKYFLCLKQRLQEDGKVQNSDGLTDQSKDNKKKNA